MALQEIMAEDLVEHMASQARALPAKITCRERAWWQAAPLEREWW